MKSGSCLFLCIQQRWMATAFPDHWRLAAQKWAALSQNLSCSLGCPWFATALREDSSLSSFQILVHRILWWLSHFQFNPLFLEHCAVLLPKSSTGLWLQRQVNSGTLLASKVWASMSWGQVCLHMCWSAECGWEQVSSLWLALQRASTLFLGLHNEHRPGRLQLARKHWKTRKNRRERAPCIPPGGKLWLRGPRHKGHVESASMRSQHHCSPAQVLHLGILVRLGWVMVLHGRVLNQSQIWGNKHLLLKREIWREGAYYKLRCS